MADFSNLGSLQKPNTGNIINFDKINFLEKDPKKEGILYIHYKLKASIRKKEIKIFEDNIQAYLYKKGFIALQGYYINPQQIIFLEEEYIKGPKNKVKIFMYFSDGIFLDFEVSENVWSSWKKNRIK